MLRSWTRAKVYADALGVEVGSGSGGQAAAGNEPAAPVTGSAPAAASAAQCNEVAVDDPTLVDYAAHYEQVVLGKKPVQEGNVIKNVLESKKAEKALDLLDSLISKEE